jgi:lipopolysaccharide/colanic/teichoic acid biosynthesis glycosyltransferase
VKRIFDLVLAFIALMLLSPLLLLTAVAIRLDSAGPVLFRQQRVGRYGKPFGILKFRSMVTDAAKLGSYMTADNDPRITRVGRFIRRTSLDELPQLLNVLRGEMSMVGPRPDVPAQKDGYTEQEWTIRHSVRPGITGLAQATLRSAATREQRKEMDLRYAQTASLAQDMRIILMTVKQVLSKGGN